MSKSKHERVVIAVCCEECGDPIEEECSLCETSWPCEAFQHTKAYRIAQLEAQVTSLKLQCSSATKAADAARQGWREYERRLKAMETYNQRLFDLASRVASLEGKA